MSEFNFHVALHVGEGSNFHHAADGVLAGLQIGDDEHLSDGYGGGHADDAALREDNHGAGLFFKWLGARRRASRRITDARTVDFYWDFYRACVGSQLTARSGSNRLGLRRSRARRCDFARGSCKFDGIFCEWCHGR